MPLTTHPATTNGSRIPDRFFDAVRGRGAQATRPPAPAATLAWALAQLPSSFKAHLVAIKRHCDAWLRIAREPTLNPQFLDQVVGTMAVFVARIHKEDPAWSQGEVPLVVAAAARLTLIALMDSHEPPRSWNEVCEAAHLQQERGRGGPMGNHVPEGVPARSYIEAQRSRRQLFVSPLSYGQPAYLTARSPASSMAPANAGEARVLQAVERHICERAVTLAQTHVSPRTAGAMAYREYLRDVRVALGTYADDVLTATRSDPITHAGRNKRARLPEPAINGVERRALRTLNYSLTVDAEALAEALRALSGWRNRTRPMDVDSDIDLFAGFLVKHVAPWSRDARLRARPPMSRVLTRSPGAAPSLSPPTPGPVRTPVTAMLPLRGWGPGHGGPKTTMGAVPTLTLTPPPLRPTHSTAPSYPTGEPG